MTRALPIMLHIHTDIFMACSWLVYGLFMKTEDVMADAMHVQYLNALASIKFGHSKLPKSCSADF